MTMIEEIQTYWPTILHVGAWIVGVFAVLDYFLLANNVAKIEYAVREQTALLRQALEALRERKD